MLEDLKWATLALTREADSQRALFPDFVLVTDELALGWEDALLRAQNAKQDWTPEQLSAVGFLDSHIEQISAINRPENLKYWDDEDALEKYPEWAEIRLLAKAVAEKFGWPLDDMGASNKIYFGKKPNAE
jgi:hypothetical protein